MVNPTISRVIIGFVAALVLLTAGATGALAHDPAPAEMTRHTEGHDIRIDDVDIRITDVDLRGPGLPDLTVNDGTYRLDGETTIEGFTVTVNGHQFAVGHTHIVVENVGVTLEDVTISGTGA